jgi:hypothetical protein
MTGAPVEIALTWNRRKILVQTLAVSCLIHASISHDAGLRFIYTGNLPGEVRPLAKAVADQVALVQRQCG